MITAHPSPQLQAFGAYALAWIGLAVLLVLLAGFSGRVAVGVAVGLLLTTGLVVYTSRGHTP